MYTIHSQSYISKHSSLYALLTSHIKYVGEFSFDDYAILLIYVIICVCMLIVALLSICRDTNSINSDDQC